MNHNTVNHVVEKDYDLNRFRVFAMDITRINEEGNIGFRMLGSGFCVMLYLIINSQLRYLATRKFAN